MPIPYQAPLEPEKGPLKSLRGGDCNNLDSPVIHGCIFKDMLGGSDEKALSSKCTGIYYI